MYYKSCAQDIGLYDQKIKILEDWDFRIRTSKKYQYAYCQNVNSAYRIIDDGLHNSEPELHYREQIKIYKKNKHLIASLSKEEKRYIYNRVYAKFKKLFISVSKKNLKRILREQKELNMIYKSGEEVPLFLTHFRLPLKSKITSIYGTKCLFNNIGFFISAAQDIKG